MYVTPFISFFFVTNNHSLAHTMKYQGKVLSELHSHANHEWLVWEIETLYSGIPASRRTMEALSKQGFLCVYI